MRTKRILSIVLTLAMLLGMFPGMNLTASAAGTTKTITPGTDDAKTGTGTMTITLTIKEKINVDEKKNGENLPELGDTNLEEIAGDLLTEEEKTQVKNGATLTIALEMTNIDDRVPSEDKKEILQAAAKEENSIKIGLFIDLSLLKRINNGEPTPIYETKTPVTFKLTMPDSLKAPSGVSRTFYLFRCHGGNAEVIAQSSGMEMNVSSD
ncbi:MAG: hypothetical protein IJ682_13715, partial [Lachnospiraceae bacterium]|nr:hypothetical protein [Lachnospiraceae bacterium]